MVNPAHQGTAGAVTDQHGEAAVAAQAQAPAERPGSGEIDLALANEASGGTANPSFHGRTVSWVAVVIIMIGFLVGSAGLVFGTGGPIWWLFWVGVGVAVAGLLVMLGTKTFDDWY